MPDWTTVSHTPCWPAGGGGGAASSQRAADTTEQGTVGCRPSLPGDLRLDRRLVDSTVVAGRDGRGRRTPAHRK